MNAEIAEEKALTTLQQLRDEKQEAKRRQEEAAQAEEQELRRIRREDRRERQQRREEHERQQADARARADFEEEKLGLAIGALPQGVPEDVVIDVAEAVRQKLPELYQSSDDIADRIVIAIARKVSRPYVRGKEAEKAAGEALKQLSFMARSYAGAPFTEWELRAREQAIAAIGRLPEAATFQEMIAAAHTAGRQTAQEYEHSERCTSMMYGVQRLLPGLLPYSSSEVRTEAEEAVQEAFARLPIGASDARFNSARDAALAPFIAGEAETKAARCRRSEG